VTAPTAGFPTVCPVCTAPLAPGQDRCGRCGALSGEHRVCPGCGARAEVIGKGGIWVCAACGRPRVPMEKPGIPRSGRERSTLARVEQAHKRSIVLTGAGIAVAVADLFVAAVLGIAALAGFAMLATIFAVVAALVALGAFVSLRRAKAAREEARQAMGEAIGLVALDVMRARGAVSAPELAEQMGIPVPVAEAALDRLPARDDVRVESVVDDRSIDGQVRYRVADPGFQPSSSVGTMGAVDAHARTLSLEEMADDEARAFDAKLQAAIAKKEAERK
jgi:hypothetical protein